MGELQALQSSSWWSSEDAVAVVTGANGGIGLEIVRGLAKHGIRTVVLTSRNRERGEEAAKLLNQEGLSNVVFHQLDIIDSDSVNKFSDWIKQNFNGIDILVNNAGVGSYSGKGSKMENAKFLIDSNYYGTRNFTEALLEHGLIRTGGRIINLSSTAARLDLLVDEAWMEKLMNPDQLTEELIDVFVEDYLRTLSEGDEHSMIKPPQGEYSVSKMALNAYSLILAKKLKSSNISVNCMCPGHTSTKLTSNTGHSAAVGAETAVWIAVAASDEISSGEFYVNKTRCGLVEIPGFIPGGKMVYPLDDWLQYKEQVFDELMKELKLKGQGH